MEELKEYIKKKWFSAYKHLSQTELKDIYVFSFFVYDDEDDPRRPTLTIGYNTTTNFNEQIINASNEQEAKWNYAFWLQNEIELIGTEDDKIGRRLIKKWIVENKLYYSDKEEDEDFDVCMEKGEKITKQFIDILIRIVKETHHSQLTDLPILIHELEYYDVIRDQNIQANGTERVKEFTEWINEMYKR
ncbi:hypothetical protein GXP67_23610 [Rhodocytophaga rosea]|uniref:DUF4303 domain-containing protein n=1 Tax=Rhodocytophaga rosea TaxID=2704465 RepID=A0A6C0GNJ2_9BACT|nr:hypothetical protein [Rhodocytophaga rosea]QHT69414.1 hypothetical protein GXP67_23610 [Rhodocytophaga rosea]